MSREVEFILAAIDKTARNALVKLFSLMLFIVRYVILMTSTAI